MGDEQTPADHGPARPGPDEMPTVTGKSGTEHLERPGDWIGPYRLLSVIGEGGFGVVWLAERREPMVQRVAIKVIKPGMDSRGVIARFEQERQALAVMDHPNVAKVLDGGVTSGGRPYFVMEHVQGEPITSFCDRHEYSIRQRLGLFIPVCEAVQHAHLKGIIHRDIKPSNILVELKGEQAIPKVIDFGVAKAMSRTLTEKTIFTEYGTLIGTPEYMSPEQAEMGALDVDTRTDVYSLGVVLYELLSGLLPLESEKLRSAGYEAIQRAIRELEPSKPSTRLTTADVATCSEIAKHRHTRREQLTQELRRELDWIPMKALRKDRAQRYQSPADLGRDVGRYLSGEALEAGPESISYRVRKVVRKHRRIVAAAALLTLTAVVALGALGYALQSSRRTIAALQAGSFGDRVRQLKVEYEASTGKGISPGAYEELLDHPHLARVGRRPEIVWSLYEVLWWITMSEEKSPRHEELSAERASVLFELAAMAAAEPDRRVESPWGEAGSLRDVAVHALHEVCVEPYAFMPMFAQQGIELSARDLRAIELLEGHADEHGCLHSTLFARPRQIAIARLVRELAKESPSATTLLKELADLESQTRRVQLPEGPDFFGGSGWVTMLAGERIEEIGTREQAQEAVHRITTVLLLEFPDLKRFVYGEETAQQDLALTDFAFTTSHAWAADFLLLYLRAGAMDGGFLPPMRAVEVLGKLMANQLLQSEKSRLREELSHTYWTLKKRGDADAGVLDALNLAYWELDPADAAQADEADKLNGEAWAIVSRSDSPAEAVERALETARRASALLPNDPNISNTLGVALYRAGRFEDALAALERAEEQYLEAKDGPQPADWAFIAMAKHRLGRAAEARSSLSQLRAIMKDPRHEGNADVLRFLKEAEALVEASPETPAPAKGDGAE